jgi:hypothetical protein
MRIKHGLNLMKELAVKPTTAAAIPFSMAQDQGNQPMLLPIGS